MRGRDSGEHVLYGYQDSGSAAAEAAPMLADVRHRIVDAASQLDALKRVNPLLQVPALQWPDGSATSESAAIPVELGRRHPGSGLLPPEPAAPVFARHWPAQA